MPETHLLTALRQDLQDLRTELQGTRESLADLRVAVAGLARHQDVLALERRVQTLEVQTAANKEHAVNQRSFRLWLWPVAISVLSTLTVLGLKVWEIMGKP